MDLLRHIRACNTRDLGGFRRFLVDGRPVGWVRHAFADRLADEPAAFDVAADAVRIVPALVGVERRTDAIAAVLDRLLQEGIIDHLRGERYAIRQRWGDAPLFMLDRAAVPYFGLRSFGIHVNGYVRRPDGLHVWIARRSADRRVAPGKLDNLVAGGLPAGLSLADNLVKEAQEEAGIGPDLARRALPVGAVTYAMEMPAGLKPDTLFVYDLALDESFRPRNTDGEVAAFELWPVEEVARVTAETDAFKFNVNHVNIDFLIRHGILPPDRPDYLDLVAGLRAQLPE